jgi:hypothetical protein
MVCLTAASVSAAAIVPIKRSFELKSKQLSCEHKKIGDDEAIEAAVNASATVVTTIGISCIFAGSLAIAPFSTGITGGI